MAELDGIKEYLWKNEKCFHAMFLSHSAVMLLIEPETGAIVDANMSAEKFYGYERERLLGLNIGDLNMLCPEALSDELDRAASLWKNSFIFPHRISNGTIRTVEVHSTPLKLGDAPVLFSIVHDITDQKRAEEDLRRYSRRLIEMEEDFKKQLATELHDEIGRDLSVLGINLKIMGDSMADEVLNNLIIRAKDASRLTESISRSVRDIMSSLRPPVLDDFGLLAALRWYADLFSKRTGIKVLVEAEDSFPRIMLGKEVALYRISQEALINAAKHSGAQLVKITLEMSGGVVRFAVADAGKGFDMASPPDFKVGSGWGINIMSERAALVGGEFRVDSAPGKGTAVSVAIPLEGA